MTEQPEAATQRITRLADSYFAALKEDPRGTTLEPYFAQLPTEVEREILRRDVLRKLELEERFHVDTPPLIQVWLATQAVEADGRQAEREEVGV